MVTHPHISERKSTELRSRTKWLVQDAANDVMNLIVTTLEVLASFAIVPLW